MFFVKMGEMYKMDTVGIKIVDKNKMIKCIKIIREYSNLSMSEIKEKIISDDYVLEGSYVNEKDILMILKLNSQLLKNGIQTELYEHDKKTNINFLNNLVTSYYSINRGIEKQTDNEGE